MFTHWNFFRNPPPTVPSPAVTPTEVAQSTSSNSSTAAASRAQALISSFADLAGMSSYLQSVILSLTKGLGVTVNTGTNPDLGRALSTIYGSVPPAISIPMYSALVDLELGSAAVRTVAGTDATVQANPFQNSAAVTITKAVEDELSSSSDFQTQLPLVLRNLKVQETIYTQWQSQLAQYPAATTQTASTDPDTVSASTVDVSDDVNDALTSHASSMANVYASMFSLLSSAGTIASDISCMISTFSALGKAEIAQIKSLFNLVKSTSLSESMSDISNGLTSFVFSQLMVDSSSMLFSLDRIGQMALAPLSSMTNSVGINLSVAQALGGTSPLVGVIRQATQTARVASGPLAGLINTNSAASSCGQAKSTAATPTTPSSTCTNASGPAGQSVGMHDLSTLLDWSLKKANEKVASSLLSLQKMMSRTQGDTCNQVKLLTIINNMGTLSTLADAFLSQRQTAGAAAAAANTTPLLTTIGTILSSSTSSNGTTYTVQNGTIVVNPPSVPAPTSSAVAVLAKAGVQTSLAGITT